MRKSIVLFFLLIGYCSVYAQADSIALCGFPSRATLSEFPRGNDSLQDFLKANIHYPEAAKQDSIETVVYVSFVVEQDGTISGVNIQQGDAQHPAFSTEVVRVIQCMPKWIPASANGKAISMNYTIPIHFKR